MRAVEDDFPRRPHPPLALQGELQPLLQKPPFQALDRSGRDAQRLGHPPRSHNESARTYKMLPGGLGRSPGSMPPIPNTLPQ